MRQSQLDKLASILTLIGRVKDRQKGILQICSILYGEKGITGKIYASQKYAEMFNSDTRILVRLKNYYNNNLAKLKPF